MITNEQIADQLMNYDPSQIETFQKKSNSNSDVNDYKCNPVSQKTVSEDGHYRSKVRLIFNPFNIQNPFIKQLNYVFRDQQGFFMVKSSLADGNRDCPIFQAWKKLWFSKDNQQEAKEWAKQMFERNESLWCLCQVVEDKNHPELEGRYMNFKIPRAIYNKLESRMNPSKESGKTPQPMLDYLFGPVLEIDVTPGPDDPKNPSRKSREITYDLCEFESDYTPITKTDKTPLFTNEELETIDNYVEAKRNYAKAKTDQKKEESLKQLESLKSDIRSLYEKAIQYLKETVHNISEEKGFREWDDDTTARVEAYLTKVLNFEDPKLTGDDAVSNLENLESSSKTPESDSSSKSTVEETDDLPF